MHVNLPWPGAGIGLCLLRISVPTSGGGGLREATCGLHHTQFLAPSQHQTLVLLLHLLTLH